MPKRSPKKMPARVSDYTQPIAEPVTKPVRVDLDPAVHHALRKAAADQNISMAALARRLIGQATTGRKGPLLGQTSFIESPRGKKGGGK